MTPTSLYRRCLESVPTRRDVSWLAGLVLLGLASAPASPQQRDGDEIASRDTASQASGAQQADGEQVDAPEPRGTVIEAILVSARGREENLEDVPLSVTALAADKLEDFRIDDATDLLGRVPGLTFSANPLSPGRDFTFLVLRGVGADAQIEPSTATYLDGVYVPSLAFDMDFLDVERVEVLRGPQGVLFGRNAHAGAVNLITREPSRSFRGRLRFGIDELESYRALAALDGPLSDRVSAGFAGQYDDAEGFVTNTHLDQPADDHSQWAGRGSVRWSVSKSWEVLLRADAMEDSGNGYAPGVLEGCRCYEVTSEFRQRFEAGAHGASLHLAGLFRGIQMTAITGYRELDNSQPFDFDGTDVFVGNTHDLSTAQDLFSQELRFSSSPGDRLSWTAGLYAFDETLATRRRYSLPDLDTVFAGVELRRQDVTTDRRGGAVFGQLEWRFGDRYELALGSRYTRQEVDGFADFDAVIPLIGFRLDFVSRAAETFKDFSPMASFLIEWSPALMTYATVSRGFKAGGFDVAPGSQLAVLPVDSETSTNYELGFKASSPDRDLVVSGAVFRVKLDNQQLQSVVVVGAVPFSALVNAGEGHTQGIELELSWRPTRRIGLELSAGYLETEFDEYVDAAGVDRAGQPFGYTPKLTGSLLADYTVPLRNNKALVRAFGQLRYVDDYFIGTGVPFNPRFALESYQVLDLGFALELETWGVTLFADNLFDDYIPVRTWSAFFFDGDRQHLTTVLPPRRVGLTLDLRF